MKHAEYVRILRPLLPREAFAPDPTKLIPAFCHLAIIVAACLSFRVLDRIYWPVLCIVIGHGIACCGLIAHEVTHRSVVRGPKLAYAAELLLWGVNFVPPTLWRKLHNEAHHLQPNALADPDRAHIAAERSWSTVAFTFLFFPSRWLRQNPLCLLHFLTYIGRHGVAAFYPGDGRPAICTGKPRYTARDRAQIAVEIGFNVLLQAGVFVLVGETWTAYVVAGPLALFVTSMVVMMYIATNHMLNPLGDGRDPVAATTSVTVPPILNLLHSNFSYHTEHHLFPAMNSKYYPQLSRLLQERFGAAYQVMPLEEAWSRLWRTEYFAAAPARAGARREAAFVQAR